jgi:hypothetical protein
MNIDFPIAVTFCVALALLGCAEAEDSAGIAGDAGVIIGWIYDGEQGCLEQASPQVALADSLLLYDERPTLGPGGVCWVLPRSQLPREGWVELDESQLPASCPDLMDVPFCGPFCPNDRFRGLRYEQDRHCVEEAELWCKPVKHGGGDAITQALAPDGTCWQFGDTQVPGDDWIAYSASCPESLFYAPMCGLDAGRMVDVDSGLSDGGVSLPDAAVVSDAAPMSDAIPMDSAISDAAPRPRNGILLPKNERSLRSGVAW